MVPKMGTIRFKARPQTVTPLTHRLSISGFFTERRLGDSDTAALACHTAERYGTGEESLFGCQGRRLHLDQSQTRVVPTDFHKALMSSVYNWLPFTLCH